MTAVTAPLTKATVNAKLRQLLRCLACGLPYFRVNVAGYRQPVTLEATSAETHCTCAGGPVTERTPGADAAHWDAAADALATARSRATVSDDDELSWALDLSAGKTFASRGDVLVFLTREKHALLRRTDLLLSETQRLRLTADRVWRRAGLDVADDRPTVALSTVMAYQVAVNRLLLDRNVRVRGPMLTRTELAEMQAALLGGVTPEAFVARIADRQSVTECVIMCRKPEHCEGCDQCQATTRERRAYARGVTTGPGSPVRWCDDCAAEVAGGLHDVFDRVA